MATQSVTLQELDRRLRKVERQIAEYTRSARLKPSARKKKTKKGGEGATVLDIARRAGLLADLPLEARARVERWRALPEDEREHILDEFYNLPLDRSLSDIIIENRQ